MKKISRIIAGIKRGRSQRLEPFKLYGVTHQAREYLQQQEVTPKNLNRK